MEIEGSELGLLQRAGYVAKTCVKSVFGRAAIDVSKSLAGLCFDAFYERYETDGMVFNIPREQTLRSLRGKFLFDTYELPERTLAKRYLPPTARVLELGGCIGVVSCTINRILTERAAHVVVEANPHLIPVLTQNRHVNGAGFKIEQCVVSRKSSALLSIAANMDSSRLGENGVPIKTMKLEELEHRYGMAFDTLVMDIEGGEAEFITENLHLFPQFDLVMLEFHPVVLGEDRVASLRSLLRASGMSQIDEMRGTEVFKRTDHRRGESSLRAG
jgi:FkbM family methyltransferase